VFACDGDMPTLINDRSMVRLLKLLYGELQHTDVKDEQCNEHHRRIEAFEMLCYERRLRVSWTHHKQMNGSRMK